MNSEIEGCIITFKQTVDDLEAIEDKLATRLNIKNNVRDNLIKLDLANLLEEDELVADWHECYASYLDSVKHREKISNFITDLSSAPLEDDELFHSFIKRSVSYILPIEMSRAFDMNKPSYQRWLSGHNAPHPRIRKHVYKFIIEKLQEELSK